MELTMRGDDELNALVNKVISKSFAEIAHSDVRTIDTI